MVKTKSAEEHLGDVRRLLVEQYMNQKGDTFDNYLMDVADERASPIEQLMAMALAFAISSEGWFGGDAL